MPRGSAPGERRGGRQRGTPNQMPDLRSLTLRALMKAGGVDYLERQAHENPGAFLALIGKAMPRELHTELSGELRVRAEVRRDLVEKLVVLMATPAPQHVEHETPAAPLPAIAHNPDTMLKAQAVQDRGELSRRAENARRDSMTAVSGAVQRAAAMHAERAQ
jgi:hypothetical protein